MFHCVIPARYASTRLPGKPLALIGGVPMIVRVAAQASLAGADSVIVATDDARIVDVVAEAGFDARLTDPDHPSGSDRVMQVADEMGWRDDAIVINVQGDEPLIPPEVIRQLAEGMARRTDVPVATLCEPLMERPAIEDPNVVKVVRRSDGVAAYFSRAAIPHPRDGFPANLADTALWWRHVGIYGYRVRGLRQFVALSPSSLEVTERLEQLRMLENGMDILVIEACRPVPGGVDTPDDLQRVADLVSE